ncbi:MAG: hypothetical protein KGQ89_04275 [Verrucomicrobia bacterium]|nr:hypothetical protein [Verrucomicrobiota bacterium]
MKSIEGIAHEISGDIVRFAGARIPQARGIKFFDSCYRMQMDWQVVARFATMGHPRSDQIDSGAME